MKRLSKPIIASMALILATTVSRAQTTALDFNTTDCNGNPVHLFADLDAGISVVLFYYMPSCGSCPPPAQKIQAMANNINAAHPGAVKAYAFPYNNTTTCTYSQTWVTSNSVPLYAPMDSGATAVAHYGGFGMPTVVLVGGSDHRVMFSTLSFSTGDTTTMRDSILAKLGVSGVNEVDNASSIKLFPNPAAGNTTLSVTLTAQSDVQVDVMDITGRNVITVSPTKTAAGLFTTELNTTSLSDGIYTVRINVNGTIVNRKLSVVH